MFKNERKCSLFIPSRELYYRNVLHVMIIQWNFSSQLLLNYFSHLCIVACVTFLVAIYSATDELFIQRAWFTPNGFLDFIPNTNVKLKKWACTQVFAFIEMNWLFFAIYTYIYIYYVFLPFTIFHLQSGDISVQVVRFRSSTFFPTTQNYFQIYI